MLDNKNKKITEGTSLPSLDDFKDKIKLNLN